MVVFSRQPGESIVIESNGESSIVTLLNISAAQGKVVVLISSTSMDHSGRLECRKVELALDATIKVGVHSDLTLLDLRPEPATARLGINAPKGYTVHRMEVWEAIRPQNRPKDKDDPDDGSAGSRIPRSPTPKPPTLDIRLDEPRSPDAGGE